MAKKPRGKGDYHVVTYVDGEGKLLKQGHTTYPKKRISEEGRKGNILIKRHEAWDGPTVSSGPAGLVFRKGKKKT